MMNDVTSIERLVIRVCVYKRSLPVHLFTSAFLNVT